MLDLARWPLPEGMEDGTVNRAQLAIAFAVSENTITKWMGQGMPVQSAGQNGVAYEFRLSHCYAWREHRDDRLRASKAKGDQLAAQAAMLFRNLEADQAEEESGLTAAEVRQWSEAEYHRNRVAEQRGALVRGDRLQLVLEDVMVSFCTALTTLPDWAEMEFGLTAAQVDKFQARCDDVLRNAKMSIERGLPQSAEIVAIGGGFQGDLAV